jgi:hypothetical protein
MASKKDKGKGKIDYSMNPVPTPSNPISYVPPIQIPPIYIRLPSIQYLFSIEKNHTHTKSPNELALSYFPPDFHWISENRRGALGCLYIC